MNTFDRDYKNLMEKVLTKGNKKSSRTGVDTISLFGHFFEFDMSNGFPLTTLRKMNFNNNISEILWFLKGKTDLRYLLQNQNSIWTGDAFKNYLSKNPNSILNKKDFENLILNDDNFNILYGDLGLSYGKQWRNWNNSKDKNSNNTIDQIKNVINEIKINPDSRRLLVNVWNVSDLDEMVIYPCHYCFQISIRENKYMSLIFNMRSLDLPLGFPSDMSIYGLLLKMLCNELDMIPDKLSCFIGDCHIYQNQIPMVEEMIKRDFFDLPNVKVEKIENSNFLYNYEKEHFVLENYKHNSFIKIPLSN